MKNSIKHLIGLAGLVLILGCGSIGPSDAPLGSILKMEPGDSTLTASPSLAGQGIYTDSYFDVRVISSDEKTAYNDVEVIVTMDFAPNQMNISDPFVQLIDEDGNVQISPWYTQTGPRGTLRVGVRVLLGVEFTGNLIASTLYSQVSAKITETLSQE